MALTDYRRDEFKKFLDKYESYFTSHGISNEEIVNDFMWWRGLGGEKMFNELLAIIKEHNKSQDNEQKY